MIEDGREGLLVPAEAPAEMSRALSRLLDDPEIAARLARAASERVRAEFGLETMIDQIEECFDRAVAGGREAWGRASSTPRESARSSS